MAVLSKFPILEAETRELISKRRPSIWLRLELDSTHSLNFLGVHPTPPGLVDSTGDARRDSRIRDAELVIAAKEIAERSDEPWIVAGDFNDVAWSHTTRLFKRISGLRDPRVGRSFLGTFIAQYPPCRCPIDHVFLSHGFAVDQLARHRITGSDHFAVSATLVLEEKLGTEPATASGDLEEARKITKEARETAEERGLTVEDE